MLPEAEETDKLKKELELLKTEYVKLLNDKDVLLSWGKPQLEALYNTRIGAHKLRLLEIQLQIKALKRKIELVRACVNQNRIPDFNEIELTIAAELAEAQLQIMQTADSVENSKHLLKNLDSPQRSAELRTIFRSIAKNLHPDVNPDLTEEQLKIWHLFLSAYKEGDLDKMKAMQLVYEKELNVQGADTLSQEQLSLAIESIKQGCKLLQDEVLAIRNDFPFTIENLIKDENWVSEEAEKMKTQLNELTQYEKELDAEYKLLISLYD